MNPQNEVDRDRLFKAIRGSYEKLEPFRKLTTALVKQYAGSGYGSPDVGLKRETVLHLLRQAVQAYLLALHSNNPACLCTAHFPELGYFAKRFQLAVNNMAREIGLAETFREWILDAFFCIGVLKIHLRDSVEVDFGDDLRIDPGRPFVSNVSLDNFVYDMTATRWSQVKFAADGYRIPFAKLKDPAFDQDVVKDLRPTSKYHGGEDRVADISRGEVCDHDEIEPMIDLMDVWVPATGVIHTFAMDHLSRFSGRLGPLASMPWNGPEFGPYKLLGFADVPGNVMFASPAMVLAGLDRSVNNMLRKNLRRAMKFRTINTYTPFGADDADNLKNIKEDGEWAKVSDATQVNSISIGGVDGQIQQFMLNLIELFDRVGGNVPAMLGLGVQAETVGQEQLIYGAVNKSETALKSRVRDGMTSVFRDLGYLVWHDQALVLDGEIPIEGAPGYSIPATWTPEDREGDYFDYNVCMDVYSLEYLPPAQRAQNLIRIFTTLIAPNIQFITDPNSPIDFQKLIGWLSEFTGEPRLKELVRFITVAPTDTEEVGPQGKPPETIRRYVRENRPTGGTPASRLQTMGAQWMEGGGAATPAQSAALSRPPV